MEGKTGTLQTHRIYLKVVTLIHIFLKFGRLGKEGKVGDLIVINMGGGECKRSFLTDSIDLSTNLGSAGPSYFLGTVDVVSILILNS